MVEGVKAPRQQTNVVAWHERGQAHWLRFDGGRSRADVGLRRATFETSDVRLVGVAHEPHDGLADGVRREIGADRRVVGRQAALMIVVARATDLVGR